MHQHFRDVREAREKITKNQDKNIKASFSLKQLIEASKNDTLDNALYVDVELVKSPNDNICRRYSNYIALKENVYVLN